MIGGFDCGSGGMLALVGMRVRVGEGEIERGVPGGDGETEVLMG